MARASMGGGSSFPFLITGARVEYIYAYIHISRRDESQLFYRSMQKKPLKETFKNQNFCQQAYFFRSPSSADVGASEKM